MVASVLACNQVSAQRTHSKLLFLTSKPPPLSAELFVTIISDIFIAFVPEPVVDITPPLALAVWPIKLSRF